MTLRDLGVRRAVIGAAWMRVSLGMALLYEYAFNYSWRYYLWGPDRISQAFQTFEWSPYGWSSSLLYFDTLFHVSILGALLFTVGVGGRFITFCVYITTVLLQDLNGLITDGGDNIARIALLYMVFADLSGRRDREVSTVVGIVHNAAILAIVVQLAFLYLSTGMYKAMGAYWQNGVALYYILRVNSFSWTGMGGGIYSNEYLIVALTYGTVLFEVAFAFALFNKWTRWLVLVIGFLFHFGIAATMGLFGFSWMMVSLYFVCLSDREYEHAKWMFSKADTGVLLYDGACGFCGWLVEFVRRRDERQAFIFEHLQSDAGRRITEAKGMDPDRLDTVYVVVDGTGCLLARSTAVVFVLRCLGWPWSLLGVAAGVFPSRFRDAVYNRVARNRYLVGRACAVRRG